MVTLVGFCNVINFCFDSQGLESEVKDSVAVRKSEKADREKLRRDRLNEHFIELGDALGKT